MATTVTTTVTTVTAIDALNAIALLLTFALIMFLIARETAHGADDKMPQWGKVLSVAIAPLAICFTLIAAVSVTQALY